MRIKTYYTAVCNNCDGQGTFVDGFPFFDEPTQIRCQYCRGIGLKLVQKTFTHNEPRDTTPIYDQFFFSVPNKVKRFRLRRPEKWKEIKSKSRNRPEGVKQHRDYMRDYMKRYRAKKKQVANAA